MIEKENYTEYAALRGAVEQTENPSSIAYNELAASTFSQIAEAILDKNFISAKATLIDEEGNEFNGIQKQTRIGFLATFDSKPYWIKLRQSILNPDISLGYVLEAETYPAERYLIAKVSGGRLIGWNGEKSDRVESMQILNLLSDMKRELT